MTLMALQTRQLEIPTPYFHHDLQQDMANADHVKYLNKPHSLPHQYNGVHRVLMPVPINRLPPEILAQVFESVLVDQYFMVPPSLGRTNVAFYNLVAVCRYWQEIAFGHGALWSSLNVTIEATYKPHHIDYFEAFLQRFHGNNLSVQLCSKPKLPTLDLTLLDALLAHSGRISRLDVKSTHMAILERLNSHKGHFPSLSNVTLSIAHHPEFNMEWSAFEIAPSLTSLSLLGGALIANGAKSWYEWNLPYHNLKKLAVSSFRAEDGCRALSVAPNLEELHVSGYFYTDGPSSIALSTRPELPALHTYQFDPVCDSFDETTPELSTRIAANLVAPNLQVLRCHADHFAYFATMCNSSKCSLKTLGLHPINAQNEDNVKTISTFLLTASTLETLSLSYTDPISGDGQPARPDVYAMPLTALFHPETGYPTMPHLQTLEISGLLMTEGVNNCLKRILANYKGLQRLHLDVISASRHFQFLDYPSQPMISTEQKQCWEELVSEIRVVAQTRCLSVVASFSDGYDFNRYSKF